MNDFEHDEEQETMDQTMEPLDIKPDIAALGDFDLYNFGDGNEKTSELLRKYLDWDRNPETRREILELAKEKNVNELQKLLHNRLEFGTAGLRGKMGAGFSNMNDLVVIQTSQGLASYVYTLCTAAKRRGCLIIGYDGRHNSKRFAELAAAAGITRGLKVLLFSKMCPTPFIPFAVKYYRGREDLKADFYGVMITASHNPKEDNGYKVYDYFGAQINRPVDRLIQESILNNLVPWACAWDVEDLNKRIQDPHKLISSEYYKYLKADVLNNQVLSLSPLRFTYTPMHGVGLDYMRLAFRTLRIPQFVAVESQKNPDPDFPTVRFPNPEEGKSALNHAIETANAYDTPIIIANDPDADRLAVAEKNKDGDWYIFNGNELGALLGWWSFERHVISDETIPVANCVMIASTVSSKILESMAKKHGFVYEETLTGFKWMAENAFHHTSTPDGLKVLFAFEEAIGFMVSPVVLDKDGISAAIRLVELATHLKADGYTLRQQLERIYQTYGYHVTQNSYYICNDPNIIEMIFNRLRNYDDNFVSIEKPALKSGNGNSDNGAASTSLRLAYPKSILNGKYVVESVRDLTVGYDSSTPNHEPRLPTSKSSQMITFTFANGLTITIRTSGTEPKIKYYSELRAPVTQKNVAVVQNTLREMIEAIVDEFIQPSKYNLLPKSD